MISFTTMETPVGTLIPYVRVTPSDEQLIAILWNNEPRRRELLSAAPSMHPTAGLLGLVIDQLRAYFLGEMQEFTVPLAPAGTEFQRAAWMALRKIPYGQTSTYASQAERIGRPTAVRAVGAANGRNPIPIIVPCHRVIGSNGALTGFAGGLDNKRWLLDHERRVTRVTGHGPDDLQLF